MQTARNLLDTLSLVEAIPSENVPALWDDVMPELSRAVDNTQGRYTMASVYESLCCADMQLWRTPDMVVVTSIYIYPEYKACCVLFMAGHDRETWVPAVKEVISDWARAHGCKRIELFGRKGWERVFKAPVECVILGEDL